MNFLDTYDIASPTPSNGTESSTQSLNEEVTQVVGQLGRLWGGFRKQSQTAFEAAKKDIGNVYSQAQKEISKFTADVDDPETSSLQPTEDEAAQLTPPSGQHGEPPSPEPPETREPESINRSLAGHARAPSQNFFARIQASLPPNLVSSVQNVQNQLPEALKHAPTSSIDFSQLRTTLTTEFHRVQGITRAQAEEYVHKSEGLLREAGEFLKEAVKVVPPDDSFDSHANAASVGALWGGSDLWILPHPGAQSPKGKETSTDGVLARSGAEGLRAVATRAQSLLKQLRCDPEVIKVDPTANKGDEILYEEWQREKVDVEEGGIGGKYWSDAAERALGDPVDGSALKSNMNTLVPDYMTHDTFWTRYFFRIHQVEVDEERRKALIQGTLGEDEDFNWDDEDEAPSPATGTPATIPVDSPEHPLQGSIATLQPTEVEQQSPDLSALSSQLEISRRQSSEDSYDVVSSQASLSGDPLGIGEGRRREGEDTNDDDDSDWE